MFKSILALAAVAALGTTMLTASASSADAKGFHKGGHHGGFHKGGHHGGFHKGHGHFGHGHHFHRHRHVHWRHRYYVPRPMIYAAPVAAVYAAKPVVNRCTCLTKEYTPEGAVLFKDICTNEAAINPPPAPQQTGMVAPPATQQ